LGNARPDNRGATFFSQSPYPGGTSIQRRRSIGQLLRKYAPTLPRPLPGTAEVATNLNKAAEPLRQIVLRESNKLEEKKGERKGCG